MCDILARLHKVDFKSIGLEKYGSDEKNYLQR